MYGLRGGAIPTHGLSRANRPAEIVALGEFELSVGIARARTVSQVFEWVLERIIHHVTSKRSRALARQRRAGPER